MSEFLAEAQVLVTPNTKLFRAELLTQLQKIESGIKPVKVVVTPDTKGFAAKLRASLANIKIAPLLVPVLPSVNGRAFAAAVKSQTAAAVAALPPVPVVTAPVTGTASEAKKTAARAKADVKAAKQAAVDIVQAQTEAQEAARQKMDALHEKALRDNAIRDQRVARASAKAAEREAARADAASLRAAEKTQARREKLVAAADKKFISSIKRQARTIAATANDLVVGEQNVRAKAAREAEKETAKRTTAENKVRRQFARISEASASADIRAASARTDLAAKSTLASTAVQNVVRAEKALTAAVATNNPQLVRQAEGHLTAANAAAAHAVAERDVAASTNQATRSQRFAARGFGATVAATLGLRGAALAANAAFIVGAGSAIAFGKAVKSAADLEADLAVLQATTGATGEEMARVGAQAEALGRDMTLPGVSASDAAEAMLELSKAGLDVQNSMDGARGVLQLATAASITNAEATELAASALNAFGLAGGEAVRVADTLANAANASQGSIVDIGDALRQSAAVARQAGLTLEETTAVLTLFARNGLRGSDAGTSFRTALIRLFNPSKKAREEIGRLGLTLREVDGSINLKLFDEFAKATRNMSKAQRDQSLAIIFGQDAIRGAAILAREGAASLERQTEELGKTGTAADIANARMSGFNGQVANLKNQMEALGITIGKAVLPSMEGLVGLLADAAAGVDVLIKGIGDLRDKLQDAFPGEGFLEKFFTESLPGQIEDAAGRLRHIQEITTDPKFGQVLDLEEARKARDAVDDILKRMDELGGRGNETALHIGLTQLDELIRKFQQGDENSKKLAAGIQQVRNQLADPKLKSSFEFNPIKFPSALDIEQRTKDLAGVAVGVLEQEGDKVFNLGSILGQRYAEGISKEKDKVEASAHQLALAAVRGLRGRAAGLDEELDALIIGGATRKQRIAKLEEKASNRRAIIERTSRPGASGDEIAERRKARQELVQIEQEIQSIKDEAAAEAQKAATKRQEALDDADQAFLASLDVKMDSSDLRVQQAQAFGTLKEQRAAIKARKRLTLDQIALIQEHVHDRELAASTIRGLRSEVVAADQEIAELGREIAESQAKAAQDAADAFTEGLQLKIQLAQLKVGESDNKDPIIRALDAAIDDARNRLAKATRARKEAQKAKKGLQEAKNAELEAGIALQELIQQRKDTLKDAEGDARDGPGTTAFDLLSEAAAAFNQTAGSLIGADQPFAGPTGFTADLAQWLRRRNRGTGNATTRDLSPGARDDAFAAAQNKATSATISLTDALNRNTDAVIGKSPTSTPATSAPAGRTKRGKPRFAYAKDAHDAQMA